MNTEIYRFQVGKFKCAIVNDGTNVYKEPGKVFFENAPQKELAAALEAHGIDLSTWTEYVSPYPSVVIDTGEHLVLVDTGMGNRVPTTGKLAGNLPAAGYRLQDFDFVVLTHVHPDHVGGILDGTGKLTYPNARYVLWDKEWEFWSNEPDLSALRDNRFAPMMLDAARTNLPPIREKLMLVEPACQIVPGVSVVPAPGHTPGQMAVVIASEGEQVLAVADAIFLPAHIEHPAWYSPLDLSPAKTVTTRLCLFTRAVEEHMLVFAPHFVFPSLGHIARNRDTWCWEPLPS
jgi:glyoxylase-like metal-dependent hydrolase (beta-lactamase superfamily II)